MKKIKTYLKKISDNRITNAIFFGIGGAIISKGMLMLFNMIVARMLGEKAYGVYSIINNTVQTFIVFAGAGLGVTLTRFVALFRDKNKSMTGIVIKTLLIINILLSMTVSIIMLVFSKKLSYLLNPDYDITIYLRITSITIFFSSLTLILQSILQGFESFKSIAIAQTLSNLMMLIIGVILTYYHDTTGTIITLLILQILMSFSFALLIRKIIKNRKITLKYKINNTIKDAVKNVAIPAFLSSIFVLPIIWFTNFKFTRLNGYEEFAAFSICLQWFNILNYLPQQLGQVKPIYTQMYDEGRYNDLKATIKKMILFSVVFSTLFAFLLSIFGKVILGLYGKFYLKYFLSFIIMLISSIFFATQSQLGSIFQAIGKVWSCFILNLMWSVIFVICFFVMQKLGALGYSLSYLVSYAVYSIISIIYFNIIITRKVEKK